MRHLQYILPLLALAACKPEPPADETPFAAAAARESVQLLIDGRYDDYVAAAASSDSLPANYRRQLALAAKQLAWQQTKLHQGMCGATIQRAEADSTLGAILVYINIAYRDSTKEEIVVPMVKKDGKWRMK